MTALDVIAERGAHRVAYARVHLAKAHQMLTESVRIAVFARQAATGRLVRLSAPVEESGLNHLFEVHVGSALLRTAAE